MHITSGSSKHLYMYRGKYILDKKVQMFVLYFSRVYIFSMTLDIYVEYNVLSPSNFLFLKSDPIYYYQQNKKTICGNNYISEF